MGVDYSCRQRSLAVCESLQHEQRVECQHRRLPQQQQREQLVSGAAGLCLIGLRNGLHIVLIVRSRFRHKESNPMPSLGEQYEPDMGGFRAVPIIRRGEDTYG